MYVQDFFSNKSSSPEACAPCSYPAGTRRGKSKTHCQSRTSDPLDSTDLVFDAQVIVDMPRSRCAMCLSPLDMRGSMTPCATSNGETRIDRHSPIISFHANDSFFVSFVRLCSSPADCQG